MSDQADTCKDIPPAQSVGHNGRNSWWFTYCEFNQWGAGERTCSSLSSRPHLPTALLICEVMGSSCGSNVVRVSTCSSISYLSRLGEFPVLHGAKEIRILRGMDFFFFVFLYEYSMIKFLD